MPVSRFRTLELTSQELQLRAIAAHERLARNAVAGAQVRPVVRDSWERSLRHHASPDTALPALVYDDAELADHRRTHPLAAVMPVIDKLLVGPGRDSGLLVAVGDENGRLLWVDGDHGLRRKAEAMNFVPGADWSEQSVGTSAPGTALAVGQGIQIAGAEHFNRQVHPWSCTAVPLHDPDTGALLGVVDITGGEEAVAVHTLSLVQAAVAAAEVQLRVERLQAGRGSAPAAPSRERANGPSLRILGRDQAVLTVNGASVELSDRHSELLAILALHPEGLTAEQLALMAYPENTSVTTVRAEMLRLRRVLESHGPDFVPRSRPYRLPAELAVDARQVRTWLRRGAHRLALGGYPGPVLPRSQAPAMVRLRSDVAWELREAVLAEGSAGTLLRYLQLPEAEYDGDAWRAALQALPPRSPRRAAVVAQLERIEAELS